MDTTSSRKQLCLLQNELNIVENNLIINTDDEYFLYIDGVEVQNLPNRQSCYEVDIITLPSQFSVIAVKGFNDLHAAGIFAYDTYGLVRTNTDWKCSNYSVDGWQMVNFNDSSWPNACASTWTCTATSIIPNNIQAIWTQEVLDHSYVYCRMKIAQNTLTIDADDDYVLYIDGVEVLNLPNSDSCYQNDTTPLPSQFSVIAIQGYNNQGPSAGIVAYDTYGLVHTNTDWKCSNYSVVGWQTVNFDDSSWPNASAWAWTCVPGIQVPYTIQSIWTQEVFDHSDVFCRIKIVSTGNGVMSVGGGAPSGNSTRVVTNVGLIVGVTIASVVVCIIVVICVVACIYKHRLRNRSSSIDDKTKRAAIPVPKSSDNDNTVNKHVLVTTQTTLMPANVYNNSKPADPESSLKPPPEDSSNYLELLSAGQYDNEKFGHDKTNPRGSAISANVNSGRIGIDNTSYYGNDMYETIEDVHDYEKLSKQNS